MKDYEYIEDLINSYVDGELDERKNNEVKRLIDNDPDARRLFESLKRYKNLMNSIPPVAAPDSLCEAVTENLEREMLLTDTESYHSLKGASRLVFRHFLTAAAMFALLAILSYVVFDIFVPKETREKFAHNIFSRKQKPQVLYERPFADAPAPIQDKIVESPKGPAVPLVARLTLITESPIETDWFIGKALMNTGLLDKTSAVDRKSGSVRYSLSCSRKSLVNLVEELSFVWPKCSETILEIGTEQQGKFITINNASARQTLDICRADNFNQRMRIAADLSLINQAINTDILKTYFARQNTDLELLIPDKPVLTSVEKNQQIPSDFTTDPANFTITVISK